MAEQTAKYLKLVKGLRVRHGTITADQQAIDVTATWNSGGTTFTAVKVNITNTASAAASKLIDLQVGSISQFAVTRAGVMTTLGGYTSSGVVTAQNCVANTAIQANGASRAVLSHNGVAGFLYTFGSDASTNGTLTFTSRRSDGSNGVNMLDLSTTAATFIGTVTTAAPTGGAGAWLLGIANAVSPTSPNRTITVNIGGTLYYIAAKTTND
jgi:hypothetical protein